MKSLFISIVAWAIRPAVRQIMEQHYNHYELTEGEWKWFRGLTKGESTDPASVQAQQTT